eukprot:1157702-Pelagomonas_calceolata.AAC.5
MLCLPKAAQILKSLGAVGRGRRQIDACKGLGLATEHESLASFSSLARKQLPYQSKHWIAG